MADIDLERTSGPGILPWLLGLVLLGAVIWGVAEAMDVDPEYEAVEVTDQDAVPAEADVDVGTPRPVAGERALALASVLADPSAYLGQSFPSGTYTVPAVPTDRGFWIEHDGSRLFALIIDDPVEAPKDINPGQTVTIEGGTFRGPDYMSQVEGDSLDDDTRSIIDGLQIYLVVDESNITITETTAN